MVKLYINNQEIELGADTALPINYQIEDITSPGNIKSEFSKTISLPSTKNNDDVLNHLYRVDRKNIDFNVSSKIPFEIRYNNRRFQTGYVKFGDITVAEDGTKTYELNLFGKLGEFFLELADKKMIDLDFDLAGNPKLLHTLDRNFIYNNWNTKDVNVDNTIHEYIKYIPMYQGQYPDFDSTKYLPSGTTTPVTLAYKIDEFGAKAFSPYRQKPSVKTNKLIESIKAGMTGYTFEDESFFYDLNEYYNNTYLTGMNYVEKTIGILNDTDSIYCLNDVYDANNYPTFDADNLFFKSYGFTDPLHIVKADGKIKFAPLKFKNNGKIQPILNCRFYFYVNNLSAIERFVYNFNPGTYIKIKTNSSLAAETDILSIDLNDGRFRLRIPANDNIGLIETLIGGVWQNLYVEGPYVNFTIVDFVNQDYLLKMNSVNLFSSLATYDANGTYVSQVVCDKYSLFSPPLQNSVLTYNLNISYENIINSINNEVTFDYMFDNTLTQKDFLLEYCRLFGLYVTVKDNKVKIDTRNSFFSGKGILDWSSKIDLSKDKVISPLVFDKAKLIFGLKENTESNFLKEYTEINETNYADKVINTGFDFNEDKLKLMEKTIYNPLVMVQQANVEPKTNGVTTETIILPSSFNIVDNNREKVKNKMSFVFRTDDVAISGMHSDLYHYPNYVIFDDTSAMQEANTYYYNLNLANNAILGRDTIPVYSTKAANKSFEFARPSIVIDDSSETNYPDSFTLYDKFWKKYIEDRYNVDTKMLKAYFMLTPVDVENLTLGEFIFFDGQYWTINKVIDYDITKEGVSTQVELISVQDLNNYSNGQTVDSAIVPVVTLTTNPIASINYTTALASGNVNSNVQVTERGIVYSTSSNPTILNNKVVDGQGNGEYILQLNGLTQGTLYYVKAYVIVNSTYYYGNEVSFTTTAASLGTIQTASVINIGGTTAQAGGQSIVLNGGTMIQAGICWSTSANPTTANSKVNAVTTPINFTSTMTGLSLNTTYHVRAFLTTSVGTVYGSDLSFLTHNIATVSTTGISSITNNTAIGGGDVTNEGLDAVTSRGIVYGYYNNPTVNSGTNFTTVNGSGFGSFTSNMSSLLYNQLYYVRAYATNANGTAYGSQTSFTTTDNALTSTNSTSNVTTNSAIVNYTANSNGGSIIYQRGICYSTSPSPTTAGPHTSDGDFDGTFNTTLTGLIGSTTYYVRSYVINSNTTFYGNQLTFITYNLPTLNTTAISNITNNSATGGGNVLTDGGTTITSRGVCWSTSSNPTIANAKTIDGSGLGSFTSSITGLNPYTTYNVRAYATNQFGTTYGNEVQLITKDVATVSMYGLSNFGNTYTTFTGKVESTGGVSLIDKGFVWIIGTGGFDINTYTGKFSHGSTVEDFSTTPNNLIPNTYYQVKAWITNQYGTTYSAIQTFTTKDVPQVTTSSIGSVYDVQVTAYGNVTFNGGVNLTRRGFVYSTSQNPTIANSFVNDGGQTGAYSIDIAGLSPATTYYVRAFAENAFGISYGSQISVLTATVPSVTTDSYNSVTSTSVTIVGNVTSANGGSIVERGVVYGTSPNPTYLSGRVVNGASLGVYSTNITGLTPGQTYHFRCYAINQFGINYGADISVVNYTLPWVEINNINSITLSTATANSDTVFDGYTPLTARGVCWSTSSNPTIANSKTVDGTAIGNYNSSITGLVQMTTYYVRAYATNSVGTSYSDNISFTTYGVPVVNIGEPDQVAYQSAVITGSIGSAGGTTISNKGFVWRAGTAPFDINSYDGIYNDGSGTNNFSTTMSNLTNNTFYQVKSFAINAFGTSYSTIKTFTTLTAVAPYITTSSFVSNLSTTSVTCSGTLIGTGGANIVRKGICYSSSNSTPTTSDNQSYTNDGSTGTYYQNLTGLVDDTTYYYRAFAYGSGTPVGYGDVYSFTTLNIPDAPTVTTDSYSIINYSSVNGTGTVTSDRGSAILERGLVYATNSNPYIGNGLVAISSGTVGQFTVNMGSLTQGTTYWFRTYAINSVGTTYGNVLSFTTPSAAIPSVYTSSNVQSIGETSATVFGEITAENGASVTSRGFVYSTNQNPTFENANVWTSGSGLGSFSVNLTGLNPNTTYYFKAYGTNGVGRGYGSQESFTTISNILPPTVETLGLQFATNNAINVNGNLVSTGNGTVTENGLVWQIGSTTNPKISEMNIQSTGTEFYNGEGGGLSGTLLHVNLTLKVSQGTLELISTDRFEWGNMTFTLWGWDDTGEVFNMTPLIMGFFEADSTVWSYNGGYLTLDWYKNMNSYFYGAGYDLSAECNLIAADYDTTIIIDATGGPYKIYNTGVDFLPSSYYVTSFNALARMNGVTPTSSDNKALYYSNTPGTFSVQIAGLTADTLYSVRAYAKNEAGESYGSIIDVSTER